MKATPTKSPSEQVQHLRLDQLVRSRFEPRKTLDQATLAELADSIRVNGVLEPLIVRPLPGPDDTVERANAEPLFEIGAGQRRWEASKLAGKTTAPCIVRELTDEQFRETAIISNLQRQDLEAMDEAEAYGELLESPGATVETVAAKVAKSPSYVGRRLQLLQAIEQVRLALKCGAIEVGHALELARLDEARQRQLLSRMQIGVTLVEPSDIEDDSAEGGVCRFCGCSDDVACPGGCSWANAENTVCSNPDCLEQFRVETAQEGEPSWHKTHYSVVELKREIADTAHVDLKTAPFPLIANLAPVPCTECPKRAGNAQLLFDDCAQDTCTDRACFHRKVNEWIGAELDTAAREKRKLLKLTRNWTSEKDKVHCSDYGGARVLKVAQECAHAEEGLFLEGTDAGRRAWICRKQDCKTHHGGSRGSSSGTSSRSASAPDPERKALLARVRAEKSYRAELFKKIAGQLSLGVTDEACTQLWTRVVLFVFERSDSTKYPSLADVMGLQSDDFGYRGEKKLRAHVANLGNKAKALFAAIAIEDGALTVHEHDVRVAGRGGQGLIGLEQIADIVGVDRKALRDQHFSGAGKEAKAVAAATARPAAGKSANPTPAKKAAPKAAKPKKALLSPAARKRIAEAQKKRWKAAVTKPTAKKTAAKAPAKKAAKKGGRK